MVAAPLERQPVHQVHSQHHVIAVVRAADVGEYEIPAFTLEVDGNRYSTQTLNLKVVRDIRGEDLVGGGEFQASSSVWRPV